MRAGDAMFDVLALLCEELAAKTALTVATEVPKERPDAFVTVFRDGGARTEHVDNPTITAQAWHESDAKAYELALQVRGIMEALPETRVEISDVATQSIRVNNYTDGHHRYELVFFLTTIR